MTSAFGGQHSIQLSYGCVAGRSKPIKKTGPPCKAAQFSCQIGDLHPGRDATMAGAGALAVLVGDGGAVLALGGTAAGGRGHLHGTSRSGLGGHAHGRRGRR